MAEPTLHQVFGTGANQDETTLAINKNSLVAVGLTPGEENSAESLFAAIIALAQQYLTETNRDSNTDQSVYIEDGLPSLITRSDQTYRQITKTVTFEKPDNQSSFNPDDY